MTGSTDSSIAIGIDIGGTGIKGAIVNTETGELLSDRIKLDTPEGGKPKDVVGTVEKLLAQLTDAPADAPIGIDFPAVVQNGKTMSAANVSKKWIGLEAEKLFEDALQRDITFVNDADAAGYAEVRYGAAKGKNGLIIMTTLGTGIGTAIIYNGVLIPNAELGHIQIDGGDYEHKASYAAKERDDLNWVQWAARLQTYYAELEKLLWPDLFIVGGGVSKSYQEFLPKISINTPMVPATLRNNAGILGAASLALEPKVLPNANQLVGEPGESAVSLT
ncbi:polyphosphate glucokinase [Subtercola boreus]|uniref:Polyphosphate glucokinase n=1 Tax=Subtercola boreus TaxID=120213 RepID=A0A3E0VKT1_9MICO|nr:ROK family protein [Subtercola boreus]RFA09477.1 polyphosphate glucokinase [Subtercola boreus]TQL53468.1 polyphosphate glucokinase [Subtercola boreus]